MTDNDDVSLPGDQGMAEDVRLNGLAESIGVESPMTSINGYMGLARTEMSPDVRDFVYKRMNEAYGLFSRYLVDHGESAVSVQSPVAPSEFLVIGDAGFYMGKEIKR